MFLPVLASSFDSDVHALKRCSCEESDRSSHRCNEAFDARQILGRVDARRKRFGRFAHGDRKAVLERAQLFERFDAL